MSSHFLLPPLFYAGLFLWSGKASSPGSTTAAIGSTPLLIYRSVALLDVCHPERVLKDKLGSQRGSLPMRVDSDERMWWVGQPVLFSDVSSSWRGSIYGCKA